MTRWPVLVLGVVGLLGAAVEARGESPPPPQYENGTPCEGDYYCLSHHCVDGVCCERACAARCEQCNQPDHPGTCLPAPAGTDPRLECPGSGPCRAVCDGARRCAFPGDDQVCEAAECVAGTSSVQRGSTCNGVGECVDRGTQDCAPFTCRAGACPTTCASEADCALGAACLGTSCGESRPRGAPCAQASQCASGFCAQGVCCDRDCTGACERCDQPDPAGSVDGTCRVLQGQSPAGACPGQGFCRGVCSAAGTCLWPDATIYCNLCLACDGAGACSQLPAGGDDDRCGYWGCPADGCTEVRIGPRCVAPGACAESGSTVVCTVEIPMADGSSCYSPTPPARQGVCHGGECVFTIPDAGPGDARGDGRVDAPPDALADRDERRYAVCGCSVDGRGGAGFALALLGLAALAPAGRRRR